MPKASKTEAETEGATEVAPTFEPKTETTEEGTFTTDPHGVVVHTRH
jgi:hypothetical protein